MSQVLIVTADADRKAPPLFAFALSIYEHFSGLRAGDTVETPSLCVAVLSDQRHRTATLVRDNPGWRAGIGTWTGPAEPPALSMSGSLPERDGAFVFAASTSEADGVRVATDPIGSLHVYAARHQGCTLIATSPLVLAAVTGADWNTPAVREFLAKGSVFGDSALHKDIHKLRPGRVFEFRGTARAGEHTYWAPSHTGYRRDGFQANIANFSHALSEAVGHCLQRLPHPVMDLTGGFDSRLLLAAALDHRPPAELDFTVSGSADADDAVAATLIARAFGLHLTRREPQVREAAVWWTTALEALASTDGEADVLEYADTLVVQRAGLNQFEGSINGSGGELIRGYWWELLWPHTGKPHRFDAHRLATARFAHDAWAEPLLAMEFENTLAEQFEQAIETELADLNDYPNTALMDQVYLRLRMQRWQGRLASATSRLWPCVSPLLFRSVIESALAAPIALRRNGYMARAVLQHMNPRLAALPMADGTPASPVTTTNFWRHAPRYTTLASRAARKLTRSRTTAKTPDRRVMALMQLAPVRALTDLDTMLTRTLYSPRALHAFLRQATAGQVAPRHVGRLLTLELTARAIADITHSYPPPSTRE